MKRLSCLLLAIGVCMAMNPTSAYAKSLDEVPGESVYGSVSEQDDINSIIERSEGLLGVLDILYHGIYIIKESITPVYLADFLDYAKTGIFEMNRWADVKGDAYWAKTMTPEGVFAGDLLFFIKDDIALYSGFSPSQQYYKYIIDHGFVEPNYYVPGGTLGDGTMGTMGQLWDNWGPLGQLGTV